MRATHRSRSAALPALFAATLITLLAAGAALHGSFPASGQSAGTSTGGVSPFLYETGTGGNVACAEITQVANASSLSSSDRVDVQGNGFSGTFPAGLDVTLASNKRSISFTSTFAITAVIVKGGNAANVYVYSPTSPARLADGGLVAPSNPGGGPADVSNVTFCWSTGGNGNGGNGVDIQALCLTEAAKADVGDIVSFTGPILIEDGAVVASSVPAGFIIGFDAMTEQVSFTAPWPVVVAITASSVPVVHLIDPPSTTGSVPFSSNPGDGELVLCGLDGSVVVTLSCAQTGADAELGPVEIREASYDPTALPAGIESLDLDASIAFVSTVPVVGIIVEASAPVLYAFATPLLSGSIPVTVGPEDEIDLVFCVLTASTSTGTTGSSSTTEAPLGATAADPTEIATGGGPGTGLTLGLVAFTILALVASALLLIGTRET